MEENKHKDCEFCSPERMRGCTFPDYLTTFDTERLKHNLIYDGTYFVVKPDISPIVKGHLLIIPKTHYYSILSIPHKQKYELHSLKQKIIEYYSSLGKHFMFFEHGCCSETASGSSCIHHAHLHAIPIDTHTERLVVTNVINQLGINIQNPLEVTKSVYLYMQTTFSPEMYWKDEEQHSQFFRIIVAEILGNVKRARWQNCIINEKERHRSEKWLKEIENLRFTKLNIL